MRVKIQNATNPTNHTQKLGKQNKTKQNKNKTKKKQQQQKKKNNRRYVIWLFLSVLVCFKVYFYPDVSSPVMVSHYTNN